MPLEFYYNLISQPCWAIWIFLKLRGIPYTGRHVNVLTDYLKSDEFSKVNPRQQIPVIVDDGFVLTESTAIMKYLAVRYNAPDHWYPADVRKQAKVDEYLAWHNLNTRPFAMKVFHMEGLLTKLTGEPVSEKALSTAVEELEETLCLLEKTFLQEKNFLCSDDITIADVMAICELMQPLGAGRDVFKKWPKLQAWKEKVEDAVGRQLFMETHKEIYEMPQVVGPFPQATALIKFVRKITGLTA
ncbi:glutathione S-transferase theta-1-like [Protopterus annectens]|uniref:glutathione S-transferase theta-1-like n=1 Tax=Protopterus annectens TaxID=7888 RepID=UPI001CFA42D9|nr:glutathione S-transferase theta-1-like [Protopterus annectens]